ncbi:MAG: dihydrofolate reductase [Clostridia bacterium]|nr:dihydrofolate reductase [Clostridia bacterium]
MKKVILSLALSIDGYIADDEGQYGWIKGDGLSRCDTEKTFDFEGFLDTVDTIVMGRKAFEDCGIEMFDKHKVVVFTSSPKENHNNVVYVNESIEYWLEKEKRTEGKDIYIFGGGQVAFPLIERNLIDEYIIGLIPIFLGSGRKLFLKEHEPVLLQLEDLVVDGGQIIVRYKRREYLDS